MFVRLALAFACLLCPSTFLRADDWPADVERALVRAKANRGELEKALREVPPGERKGMAFLIVNMPETDLLSLKADFLKTNSALAHKARRETPWGKDVPEDLFLNDVLAYANVDEKRDPWRAEFFDLCMPIVKDCKTAAEAGHKLNTVLFKQLKLRYRPQEKPPSYSPKESIANGTASCTGLSIVLCDACRAVCVPARLVGTPNWIDKRGNHTWVEIWDKDWRFAGAAEASSQGLDRGWFTDIAARAQKDSIEHAIYAVSFRKTDVYFPLAWAAGNKNVSAQNVTDRYAKATAFGGPPAGSGPSKSGAALAGLRRAIDASPKSLADLAGKGFADVPLTKADAEAARAMLWRLHETIVRRDRTQEIADRVIVDDDLKMRFDVKTFGDKPKTGRGLWISLHGGGGAPRPVNDQQWHNQKKLYSLDEGIYLVPRAPTDTWNLWHQPHVDRMLGRLIEDLIVLEDVNPDRVYVLGYSAGGDGVYQLAPRMADRWAGAAMMAGHPNGVSLLSLRNVPFALQVGGKDTAYNRNRVGREYGEQLDKLQKDDPKGYPHFVKIHENKAHWMDLEDKAALPWMAKFTRDPAPERVVWKQTGTVHERSYWLAVPPKEGRGDSLVAVQRNGQTIDVTSAEKVSKLLIRLDDRIVDLAKPVVVTHAGKELYRGMPPRTIGTMIKTLAGRGDPKLTFDAEIAVDLPAEKKVGQ